MDLWDGLQEWEVGGTGSGLCPVADCGVNPLGSATPVLVRYLIIVLNEMGARVAQSV
jgi:hypothetical protein